MDTFELPETDFTSHQRVQLMDLPGHIGLALEFGIE